MTEIHRVRDLAKLVAERTEARIQNPPNPRKEDDENGLHVSNDTFLDLGLKPITLSDGLLDEIAEIARKYVDCYDLSKILCVSAWNDERRREIGSSDVAELNQA